MALDAFYQLTYEVPKLLEQFPDTARLREQFVRQTLEPLERLSKLSGGAHEVLRELATNYRLLGTTLVELKKWRQALAAFEKSARHSKKLIKLQPSNALYHRDLAVSYLNAGYTLEKLRDMAGASDAYKASVPSARRAAELDGQWATLPIDAQDSIKRLEPQVHSRK